MCAAQDSPKRLPIIARVGLVILLITVALIFGAAAFWLTKPSHDADISPEESLSGFIFTVVLLGLGVLSIGAGAVLYVIVLATNCFFRDWSRPFFNTFKARIYACQIVVSLPFILGLGLLVSIPLYPRLISAGIDPNIALVGPVIGVVALAQVPLIWIQLWAPLEKSLIHGRMRAMGIGPDDLERGRLIGISDPGKSTLKKLTLVEDDMGMLWITPDALVYLGDTQFFQIRREHLRAIEQKADAANPTALAGAAHVILSFVAPDQQECRVRLHVEGVWTLGRKARVMDELAATLRRWEQGDPAVAVPAPVPGRTPLAVAP